jgi:hypothetical protein
MVGRIPRTTLSSATSRHVHWRIVRPDSPGAAQASATIWHGYSAVIPADLPLRGASASRSSTLNAASPTAYSPSQRRAMPMSSTRFRTIWALLRPAAAASTIRARSAIAADCGPRIDSPIAPPRSLRDADDQYFGAILQPQ